MYTVVCDHVGAARFTDVDYLVFSDAANLISEGKTPYLRATYRYTPLLAAMLAPLLQVHTAAGKVLFCLGDLVAARCAASTQIQHSSRHATKVTGRCFHRLLQKITRHLGATEVQVQRALLLWLANPFVFAVSARGSADSLTAVLQLSILCWLLQGTLRQTDSSGPHLSSAGAEQQFGSICAMLTGLWHTQPALVSLEPSVCLLWPRMPISYLHSCTQYTHTVYIPRTSPSPARPSTLTSRRLPVHRPAQHSSGGIWGAGALAPVSSHPRSPPPAGAPQ